MIDKNDKFSLKNEKVVRVKWHGSKVVIKYYSLENYINYS